MMFFLLIIQINPDSILCYPLQDQTISYLMTSPVLVRFPMRPSAYSLLYEVRKQSCEIPPGDLTTHFYLVHIEWLNQFPSHQYLDLLALNVDVLSQRVPCFVAVQSICLYCFATQSLSCPIAFVDS